MSGIELSIVMPCLNEAETLEICIRKARGFLESKKVLGEVIVADNGSTDDSRKIAIASGARLVDVEKKGYGSALMGGIEAARGKYIIMGDADDSYDFSRLTPFLEKLRRGYDLVMGNRFKGGIQPGAMPLLHRYLGNPVLTGFGRLFFRSKAGDFHCGLRGFSKEAVMKMNLQTTGMEFASEIVVKAALLKMKVAEVPTTLSKDGRTRPPHLRSWRDGWRHLRFLLLYSPRWLFLYPGIIVMLIGAALGAWLFPSPRFVGNTVLDVHSMLYAAGMISTGFQLIIFAVFSKIYGTLMEYLPRNRHFEKLFKYVNLEVGLIAGAFFILAGMFGSFYAVYYWAESSFGPLDSQRVLRWVIPSVMSISIGCQIFFSSFFLSIMGIKNRKA